MNAVLGLHISAAPLPFCSCFWAQQRKRGNKSRISHTQEEKNLRQQLTGSRTYVYCHLPPHIWKATSLPRGRKILLLSPSEARRAPHQLAAGSALSGGSFSCCATLPGALMEPVINSALYSSLMPFHSRSVDVVSLPWQKASRLWVVVSDWWLVVLSITETPPAQSSSCTILILSLGRGWLCPCCPWAHQRGGIDPGWCRDMGQHSILNPDPEHSLQTPSQLHIAAWGGTGRKRRNEEQK